MKLGRRLYIAAAACSLLMLVVAVAVVSAYIPKTEAAEPAEQDSYIPVAQQTAEPPADPLQQGFWVQASEGYVTVYDAKDRATVVETTEIALRGLRLADQELLKKGIWIADRESLAGFLEDFGP